jgi:hypothetical protein
MSIPSSVKIIRQGAKLRIKGLASLPKAEQAQVVDHIRQNKEAILLEIERASEPAKQLVGLVKRGLVRLHTDGAGGLWWSPVRTEDVELLDRLWMQGYPELFQALYRGELDGLARMQCN